jgi:TonB-linked SusC/RagA family outer membrane protein
MKLAIMIIVAALVQIHTAGYAQNVTLDKRNAPLSELFKEIKRQTGYDFLYNARMLEQAKKIDINVKNLPLINALDKCFEGQPLTYSIDQKTIVVKQKKSIYSDSIRKERTGLSNISGTISDTLGIVLSGASVYLKEINYRTVTNKDGHFKFSDVAPGAYTLVASYVGFVRWEKTIAIEGKRIDLPIIMQSSNSTLDAVNVIAYGTETKRFSVGSTATIITATIAKQPVSNVLLALEGQATGLIVLPTAGAPGSYIQVQLRGQNTLDIGKNIVAPSDQPLFIIDGLPFAPQNNNISLSGGSLGGINANNFTPFNNVTGISPFSVINPADIESITILKDADATSIYGTQGSHGVILITTKKGKAGKLTVSANVNTSTSFIARPLKMLNTEQYLALRNEGIKNDGLDLTKQVPTLFADLLVFDQHKYTNWYKRFFDKIPISTDIHTSLTGGAPLSNFIFSTGVTRNKYNFPGDFAEERLTLHSAFHHGTKDGRFNLDFGTDFSYDHNNSTSSPDVVMAYVTPPNVPDLLDEAGNLIWAYKGININRFQQYSYLKTPEDLKSYSLNNTMRMFYKVMKDLTVSVNAGYSRFATNEYTALPRASQGPGSLTPSSANFYTTVIKTVNIEPQIDYKHVIGKGFFSALLGGTYKKNSSGSVSTIGNNYPSDALLKSIDGAATVFTSDSSSIYKYTAVFARVRYIYDSRYIISLTGRRDGSSNFSPGRQFGNFGSAGLGWILSEEKNFKKHLPFFSFFKLSGTYGTSGSDGIAPYLFQPLWAPAIQYYAGPFQGIKPYTPLNLYNPDYSWSIKRSLNAALDLGFFKDRLLLNVTYFRDRTGNQLTSYDLPSQTGFTQVLENINATVQNKGWEFTATVVSMGEKDFKWSANFNLSIIRNKLLAFPGLATSSYANRYVIGKSINTFIGFKYKDVNPQTGLYEFYSAKGSVTTTPQVGTGEDHGDLQPIVDLSPQFTGGLGNSISYKGWNLYFFFQFAKQTGLNYLGGLYHANRLPGTLGNLPVQVLDHWKNPGDISNIERATVGDTDAVNAADKFAQSSGAFSDASYIRLKTLSLDYTLTFRYLKNFGVRSCRVFISSQNLLTMTGYKVGDPETPGNLFVFPLQRTISCGLSLNF